VAVQSWPIDVICLYDTTVLAESVLADVRRVHPWVRGEAANPDYDPQVAGSLFEAALIAGPTGIEVRSAGPSELSETRDAVRLFGIASGLPGDKVEDLVVAANEIVTNSIRHGGGSARIALWEEGGSVVCEVTDAGRITDPLAGRLAPSPTAGAGRGLWLANQLCDLVQIRSSASGTVVRLFVDRL
jgi:anti-sigma regulatory factor (Ser/Thr protein kinase)